MNFLRLLTLLSVLVFGCLIQVKAQNLLEPNTDNTAGLEKSNTVLSRAKRSTCSLLPNQKYHACYAQCIIRKYKSGYCNSKGLCICRN